MRPKGRMTRRALRVGLMLSAVFMIWSAVAQADVVQKIPLADSAFVPRGLASDGESRIFVSGTTTSGGVVQRLVPGQGYAVAETLPFGTLTEPVGVAWQEGAEAVYVLDRRASGSVVLKLEKEATTPTTLPFGTIDPSATQLAVDSQGDVFIAADAEHKVIELENGASAAVTLPIAGLEGAAGISYSNGILAVADENAKRIVEYDVSSQTQSSHALPNEDVPGPISYNHYGSLYIFDQTSGGVVAEFGPSEHITLRAGSPEGPTPGAIAAVGQGGESGAFFLTGVPSAGLWQNVDTIATPPKIRSPYLSDENYKINVPLAVNDPHNITVPFSYEVAEPHGEELVGFTVLSSNPTVVPPQNVTISRVGVGNQYQLSFEPLAPGRAQLTLEVAISPGEVNFLSLLGTQAIEASVGPEPRNANERFLLGASNASSALAVGDGYFLDVDDDDPAVRLYQGDATGFPVKSWEAAGLGEDTDFEAIARSGNTVFQADSFGEGIGFSPIIAYSIRGEGAATELQTKDVYYGLEQALIDWDNSRGAALGLEAASQEDQKNPEGAGLALEGLEFAPDGTTAYLGFRVPLQPKSGSGERTESLIVPVKNFAALFTPGHTVAPEFGEPIIWKLGGLGIREIRKNASDEYLIISGGPSDVAKNTIGRQALWTWDGNPADAPRQLKTRIEEEGTPLLHGITGWEGIVDVPDPLVQGAKVTLIQDDGKAEPWGPGTTTQKKMRSALLTKSMTDVFTIDFGRAENRQAPTIGGLAAVGQALSCDPGTWTGSPTFTFTWLRDGAAVASGPTYTPVAADAGHRIACEVTATNGDGATVANSAAVEPLPAGLAGPEGEPGATGAAGPSGASGPAGVAGPTGAGGPQGVAGRNGRDAVVTCKVSRAKGGPHVTCAVGHRKGAGQSRGRARRRPASRSSSGSRGTNGPRPTRLHGPRSPHRIHP